MLCCGLAGPALAQDAAPVRVRGTIDAVDAQTMRVTSREGPSVTLAVASKAGVTAIAAATIADIKPGSYIGTAAMPQPDGSAVAQRIGVGKDGLVPPM